MQIKLARKICGYCDFEARLSHAYCPKCGESVWYHPDDRDKIAEFKKKKPTRQQSWRKKNKDGQT